jgi:GGDEF domain-containing protein
VTYIGIGVLVGDVNLWYVAMYAGGALGLAVTFGVLGRSAARQRQLLTRLSRVDALTECLNRRGFEERMEAELSRIARNGGSAQLLLLDLDGFKGLNDTQGHAAGDALLVWVAETLRAATREQGAAGRLGGDEFVVLLTEPVDRPARARRGLHRHRDARRARHRLPEPVRPGRCRALPAEGRPAARGAGARDAGLSAGRQRAAGSVLSGPVRAREVLGVLTVARVPGRRAFTVDDLEMTSGFAHQAAVAIELARGLQLTRLKRAQ